MSDMNDRVAVITGASSGIGRATGEAFAARGAKVVLAARREQELATLSSEIASRGGKATFVVTDVAVATDVERMVAHAMETFGRLDYAVNNAGNVQTVAGQKIELQIDTIECNADLPADAFQPPPEVKALISK